MGYYLWNPRPSMRTTMYVLGSRVAMCSKALTCSYLEFAISIGKGEVKEV